MRGGIDHLMHLAKKKPKLQEIIDTIHSYQPEYFETLVEFPGWVRKCLRQYQHINARELRMATLNLPSPNSVVTPEIFDVYRYTGCDYLINDNSYDAMQFEINTNDIFFICDDMHVKINSMAIKCVGSDRQQLLNNCKYVDKKDIYDYNEFLQKVLEEKHGLAVEDERNSEYGYLSAIRFER